VQCRFRDRLAPGHTRSRTEHNAISALLNLLGCV
jgi:hypothetical protein